MVTVKEHTPSMVGPIIGGLLGMFVFFVVLFWIVKPVATLSDRNNARSPISGWALVGLAALVTIVLFLLLALLKALVMPKYIYIIE